MSHEIEALAPVDGADPAEILTSPEQTAAAMAGLVARLNLFAVMRGYAVDGRAALQSGDHAAAETALLLLSSMAGYFWAEIAFAAPPQEVPPSLWTAADNLDFWASPALRRLTSALRRAAPEAEATGAAYPDAFPPILVRILANIAGLAAADLGALPSPPQSGPDPELEAALDAAGVSYTAPQSPPQGGPDAG